MTSKAGDGDDDDDDDANDENLFTSMSLWGRAERVTCCRLSGAKIHRLVKSRYCLMGCLRRC